MGVEAALLEAMLTRRVVKTGREEFTKKLGVQDAALSRDAVVKALFQVRERPHPQQSPDEDLLARPHLRV